MRLLTQLEKDKYIILDKNWFSNNDILKEHGYKGLSVYCFMMRGYTYRQEILFSINKLVQYLNIKNTNTKARNNIIDVVKKFSEKEMFQYDININKIKYTDLVTAKLTKPIESFIYLYDFEIEQIMNCKYKVNKDMLLTLFAYIKGSVNSETKVAYPPFETIRRYTNVKSDNTISQYISILKEIGLLLYDNVGFIRYFNGVVKEANNIYVMNYEGCDEYLKQGLEEHKKKINIDGGGIIECGSKEKKNIKRSETMIKIWAERKAQNN